MSIDALEQDLPAQGQCTISLHEGQIPEFAKCEMERLYQNTFSSIASYHVADRRTSTCVVRAGSAIVDVFLFQVEKHGALVLNSATRLASDRMERLVQFLFNYYADLRFVKFMSVVSDKVRSTYPLQQFEVSEDIVVALPASVDAYNDQLGKTTVKRFQYYEKKIRRDFPRFRFDVVEPPGLDSQTVRDVIALRAARADARGTESGVDGAEAAWIERAVALYGFLGVSRIDGKICAGAICTRVGDDFFVHLVAHDARLDQYSIGILNSYLTICAAIGRGGREYHFLWGSGAWKYRLLGVARRLDDIVVYRSRSACFRSPRTVLSGWYAYRLRRLKRRVCEAAASPTPVARLIRPCLDQWQRVKAISRRRMGPGGRHGESNAA